MHADVPNHEPSLLLMNCGEARQIRPSIGSWVTYGLGTENQNLPGFIVMCPGGYPIQEIAELAVRLPARRLPGHLHRHAAHRHREADREHPQQRRVAAPSSAAQLDLLRELNAQHQRSAPARRRSSRRASSRSSWPTACRWRRPTRSTSASEPQHIRDMYGPGVQARQILIARRLLERGVRFVQVWHGAGPAVGQPRRPRGQPPQAGRRVRPGDRRLARRT